MGHLNPPIMSHSNDCILNTQLGKKKYLYHYCLGHPSFRVIQLLFRSFFKDLNLNMHNLHCDVCELATHKHVSFSLSCSKISPNHFYLVCVDPFIVSNFSIAK